MKRMLKGKDKRRYKKIQLRVRYENNIYDNKRYGKDKTGKLKLEILK